MLRLLGMGSWGSEGKGERVWCRVGGDWRSGLGLIVRRERGLNSACLQLSWWDLWLTNCRFALERTVINWDTSYLEGRLLSLISSTSYRGHVTVSFPLTHNRVVIHSPDKVNRFFSNVAKVFTGTKKYEVIKSVWPYADVPRGETGRRCAVQEEEVWFRNWSDSIRHAVMGKRKGWVTIEDRLEFLMEPKVAVGEKPADWGNF